MRDAHNQTKRAWARSNPSSFFAL